MDESLNSIIWFHKLLRSTKKGRKALAHYGSCEALYKAIMAHNEETGLAQTAPMGKYESFSLADAQVIVDICKDNGWEIITYLSEYYPKELLLTDDYPMILFCDGNKEILKRPVKISIVGSREAKEDAEEVAYNSAYNLAKTGALIVSGAALGIDSSAHLGAIEADGETVGVLGCGLGNSYMNKIGDFYSRVTEKGAYVTEMFPFEKVSQGSFPERNRIISGMSRAVLVTCAAEDSGSLITADYAKKQKRRVYAMAPEVCYSKGCEQLIENGAYGFYNAGDIAYPLKEYFEEGTFNEFYCNRSVSAASSTKKREDMALPKKNTKSSSCANKKSDVSAKKVKAEDVKEDTEKVELPETLSENAKLIYNTLTEVPMQRDSLVDLTGLRIPQVLCAVSELETFRLIRTVPGGRIEKTNRT